MRNIKKRKIRIKIKTILVEALLIVIRLALTFKYVLEAVLAMVFSPMIKAARFVFYKFIVKIYCVYLAGLRKLGWSRFKGNFLSFLFNHRTVHFVVFLLVVIMSVFNFFSGADMVTAVEKGEKTIVSELISSEFGENGQNNELIVETSNGGHEKKRMINNYSTDLITLNNAPSIATGTQKQDEPGMAYGIMVPEPGVVTEIESDAATNTDADDRQDQKERDGIINYTVQSGDTISSIASRFGVSVNTVLWENGLSSYDIINVGDKLRILPMSGVAHEVASGETLSYISNRYDVDKDEIMEANDMADAGRLSIGQELIIPGGRKIERSTSESSAVAQKPQTQKKQKSDSGLSVIRDVVSGDTPSSGTKMHWPTDGHTITQYYSWRHHGLDVANRVGTPIYSSDAGTVELAGWSRGYGNNIIVNHGGGKKTRYAHLSKFRCRVGDRVSKGEVIGDMGNTGWSTGPHLHFEVIINSRKLNPLNYIR
jgi:LysM repeat protein